MHVCSVVSLYDPMDCNLPGYSVHGDFPGKNIGVGCYFLLQGIFLTQELNPRLLPLSLALKVDFFTHWAIWEAKMRSTAMYGVS